MSQFSVITQATRDQIAAAVGTAGLGNRRFHAQVTPSRDEPGLNIVSVPAWAGSSLVAGLKRIGAWFDRPQAPMTPRGRPVVSHAGASTVRNYKRLDKQVREDRKVRRAMKAS